MKTALCTTTINIPRVLELYRACGGAGHFFVAPDRKTPPEAAEFFEHHRIHVAPAEPWKCWTHIGDDTLAKRNLAFLEALKWGADIVVSIDDDNYPMNTDYFWGYQTRFFRPFNGLVASSQSHWFDAGQLLVPWARHRGIPHGFHAHEYAPVTNAKIGVMAGLVLGNSDVDATTRIETPFHQGTVQVSELAISGVIVSQCTHTVFNTQNTAVLREFVPAWFLMPGVGRFDDIYASLVVQRVMRERDYHVHFGRPFVYQQRNPHDLIKDLRAEIDGYEFIKPMATLLDQIVLRGKSVIDDTRTIYEKLRYASWIPEQAVDAAMAYLDDCEGIV